MATYTPRPDGLVDVIAAPGGPALPMTEQQAQAGGATLEPPANGMPELPTAPNPYSMIGSGDATAQLAQATQAAMKHARDGQPVPSLATDAAPAPTPAPAAPVLAAPAAAPAAATALPSWATGGTFDQEAAANAPGKERAEQARKAHDAAEQAKLRPVASTPAREGGYQLDQPLQLTGGGVPLESRVVRPGVKGEPSFKKIMSEMSPEGQRDEHLAGAQNVYLAREQAIESERLANESQAIENAERKEEIAGRRAKLEEKRGYIEQREREAADATPQSRSEIMASRGTLSKMMGALSLVLGARYQGFTGRNNPGLDMLNQTIAQDIADQRAKYEASKDRVGMANNDYARAMQLYGDPNIAEADLHNRGLQLAANIAQNHWKRAENEGDYSKQKEVAQAILELAAGKKQEAFTLLNGQVLQETYKREAPTVQGMLSDDQTKSMVYVPGYGNGFVANSATQPDVQKRAVAGGTAMQLVAELMALMPKSGPINDLEDRKRLDPFRVRTLAAISQLEGQGIVTKDDAANAEKILGDENAFFTGGRTSLEATEKALRIGMDSLVQGYLFGDPHRRTRLQRQRAGSFTPGLP